MTLKYYPAYLTIVPSSPQQGFLNDLQQTINDNFANASDVYSILEEKTPGMLDWQTISVRITHVLSNNNTSDKKDDDWRNIIFSDITHVYALGIRYFFDNNYWLTDQSDIYHYSTASAIIRRCNNTLKWIDINGVLQNEPCIIDAKVQRNRNIYNALLATYEGFITVICQQNKFTNSFVVNQRFVFNGQAYKVMNLENYFNKTSTGGDAPELTMIMNRDTNNDVGDDLILNIANTKAIVYTISVDQSTFSQIVGFTTTLSATVKLNGDTVTNQPVTWLSSAPTIGTINSSTGVINLIAVGSVNFIATMANNPSVSSNVAVTVTSALAVTATNIILPNVTSIIQNTSQTYNVYHYKNDVADTSVFSIATSGASSEFYNLQIIDGNHFSITSLGYTSTKLLVTCTNTTDATTTSISIQLEGAW